MSDLPEPQKRIQHRWEYPGGKRAKPNAPGAARVPTESDTYYVRMTLGDPPERKWMNLDTTDLGVARKKVRDLVRAERDRELGLTDDGQQHLARPIAEHLAEWLKVVAAGNVDPKQVGTLRSRLAWLVKTAGWRRIADVNADSLKVALARLMTEKRGHGGRPCSTQTRNHYLSHARQFCLWLVESGRLPRNPVAGVKAANTEADRRHDRHLPTQEQLDALLKATEAGPVYNEMPGPSRALMYRVACATGYRAAELRSLTRQSFDLDNATVSVAASYSKRGRRDTQHLPPWLVADLRAWFAGGGGLWGTMPASWPGRVLQQDLANAGVPYAHLHPDGHHVYFDMHAFRHWYVTGVANLAGMSPKLMMEMARHSDPKLTLKTYAKAHPEEVRRAVGQLPRPGGSPSVVTQSGDPQPGSPDLRILALEALVRDLAAEVKRLRGEAG